VVIISVSDCTFLLHFVDSERVTFRPRYSEVCAGVCCLAASGCDDPFEAAGHEFIVWVVLLSTAARCSLTLVELQIFGIKQVYNLKRFLIYNICVVVVWCVWGCLNPFAFVSFAPRHCKLANLEHRNCISVALRNNHQC